MDPGETPPPELVPTIQAYGADDDHLRIPVLLAAHLREHAPDAADTCLRAKKNPWDQRRKALAELLDVAAREVIHPVACLDDLDAMEPGEVGGERRWDDATFALQRHELMALLLKSVAERGLFTLRRPFPEEALSSRLGSLQWREQTSQLLADDRDDEVSLIGELPLDLRPVARWLVSVKALDDVDLEEIIDESIQTHMLALAWDRLKPAARGDALRICAFRSPMYANGAMGPFAWAPSGSPPHAAVVSRPGVQQLQAAGFLQQKPGPGGRWAIPRAVRSFVYEAAMLRDPEVLGRVHSTLAMSMPDGTPEEATERHHQAVAAGDVTAALATARYYGADLRELARRRSQSAREALASGDHTAANVAFEQAAQLYQEILGYDPEDAYAWEYHGYNLWQPYREAPQSAPASVVDAVGAAYKNACRFDSANPLFRGRLLAFEAGLNRPYTTELRRYSKSFYGQLGDAYLTWYFEPVLSVLKQQDRHKDLEALRALPGVRRAEQRIQMRRGSIRSD